MTMDTYYFTFGQIHVHPDTQELLREYWIEIVADSSEKARRKMFELFGAKWAFQYRERVFMGICSHFSKGCYAKYELD